MGQKTNPTALRLNKTNKRFDSLWYNKLHYSRLVRDELVTKSYIEQVFAQASVPRNLWSFSPSFKRGRGLILYLSPDKCRAAKSTKLRLRKFTPLLHRGTNTAQEIKPVLTYMSDQDTCLSHYTIYHFKNARPVLEKKTWALQEKRFLVHFLLTLLMSNTSSKSKALLHHDLSLFQKAHTLLWTQGNGQIINFLWHRLHS
jgi:hypothetical protein